MSNDSFFFENTFFLIKNTNTHKYPLREKCIKGKRGVIPKRFYAAKSTTKMNTMRSMYLRVALKEPCLVT